MSSEPLVLRNDVPTLERLLALLFVMVGGPLTYLGWTQAEELPELVVPVVQIGLPLFVLAVGWRAFVHRRRLAVTFAAGDPLARFEERVLFVTRRWTAPVVGAEIEMSEDIDGDPYGSLVLHIRGTENVIAAEGNDIERLESQLADVVSWVGGV